MRGIHFIRHLSAAALYSRDRRVLPTAHRAVLFVLMLLSMFGTGGAADEVHRRTGRLAVASPFSPMIAVDFRDSDLGGFVVGKIVGNSILQRGRQQVGLHDFVVGETVRVTWKKSAHGVEIITLLADDGPSAPPASPWPLLRKPGEVGALIGEIRQHTIGKKDTLLDIARRYDLGFNEIMALYPQYDPWLPPVGEVLDIPGRWLLPEGPYEGLVINIPEMRLFAYRREKGKISVRTYPIGIGDTDYPTPTGTFRIGVKRRHPTWYIPPSLQAKYQQTTFPPGEDNPLGDYWIGLENTLYGIHGTDIPWSVGRLVTRGCIRMYPEDIAEFFPTVAKGTRVRLVYQPVKIAFLSGRLLVEVHRDIYSRVDNLAVHGLDLFGRLGLAHLLDTTKFVHAIVRQNGVPTDITLGSGAAASNEKQ